ncbi:MAG TPA: hypothetical protein VI968_03930 [archaeon]|nr:hypothetical protein [archaeon]
MKVVKTMAIFAFVLFFLSWSFFGNNNGFNYNSRSYFPSYSSGFGSFGTPNFYIHANSGPMVNYRGGGFNTFTIPAYYTTFGNYRYW